MCQYFGQQELFQRIGSWAQYTNWEPVFDDVDVLAILYDRDDYRLVPYYRYLSGLY